MKPIIAHKPEVAMKCILFICSFSLLLTLSTPSGAAQEAGGLQALINEALEYNQELKSLRQEAEALKAEAPAAGALPDPKVKFSVQNLPIETFDFSQEPMTQKQITVSQQAPWINKLSLRIQKVLFRAKRVQAQVAVREQALIKEITAAYYDLGFVNAALDVNTRRQRLVSDILRATESLYAAGQGQQQDILQAQVEFNQLLEERIELDRTLRTTKDRINELLHREQYTNITPPEQPAVFTLKAPAEELARQAVTTNASLQALKVELEQARIDIKLAIQQYMPDFDFSLSYGQRDNDQVGNERADFFSASVGFSIPLWFFTKQDKSLAGARKRFEARQMAFNSLKNGLTHKIDALATEINTLYENYTLLDEALILQASQWSDASVISYQVGGAEFDTMIRAQLRLLKFELQHMRYHYTLRAKLAELEELVGAPVAIREHQSAAPAPERAVNLSTTITHATGAE